MSSIKIKEYDNTKASLDYSNFGVVVPGFVKNEIKTSTPPTKDTDYILVKDSETDEIYGYCWNDKLETPTYEKEKLIFDYNGVYTCNSQYDFKNYIGFKEATAYSSSKQYGNQIAYELIGLGYTVLFKLLTDVNLSELAKADFWAPLKDRAEYDYRYVLSGLIENGDLNTDKKITSEIKANEQIKILADFNNDTLIAADTGRGDIIGLFETPAACYKNNLKPVEKITAIKEYISALPNKFCAHVANYVEYDFVRSTSADTSYDDGYNKNRKFPAGFHFLACAAKARQNYAEWYMPAGYTRGISDFNVVGSGCKLGESAIQVLQARTKENLTCAANMVVCIRGEYLFWGNRTANKLGDELVASDFFNIREICCTLKKQIYLACRQLTFDPNSDILWTNFKNKLTPILEKMKNDQGIEDYEFVKVADSRRALLNANIRIVPIEAVEDFEIGVYLEDSLETPQVSEM